MSQIYKACFVLPLLFFSAGLFAQPAVTPATTNVAGGSYVKTGSYFRFEWSLGELVAIQTFSPPNNSLFLTQGVLQPNTEAATLSPALSFFAIGEYHLFPSPTTGPFEVNFSVRESGFMTLQLTDVFGKILQTRSFPYYGWGRIEKFDLSSYTNGTYFIVATLGPDNSGTGSTAKSTRHGAFRVVKIK